MTRGEREAAKKLRQMAADLSRMGMDHIQRLLPCPIDEAAEEMEKFVKAEEAIEELRKYLRDR